MRKEIHMKLIHSSINANSSSNDNNKCGREFAMLLNFFSLSSFWVFCLTRVSAYSTGGIIFVNSSLGITHSQTHTYSTYTRIHKVKWNKNGNIYLIKTSFFLSRSLADTNDIVNNNNCSSSCSPNNNTQILNSFFSLLKFFVFSFCSIKCVCVWQWFCTKFQII